MFCNAFLKSKLLSFRKVLSIRHEVTRTTASIGGPIALLDDIHISFRCCLTGHLLSHHEDDTKALLIIVKVRKML